MTSSSRYELLPGLLLGFHGTDESTAEKVLSGKEHLSSSNNDYDWLGNGIYFWEYSPERALEFATSSLTKSKQTKGKIKKPAVVGAVIDPGVCLNLLEASALQQLKTAYDLLKSHRGDEMPENKGGVDMLMRHLDCAVIETVHLLRAFPVNDITLPDYDTVRGAFWEGAELYPGAGFKEKNHVQICVRNLDCIKGYFRVLT